MDWEKVQEIFHESLRDRSALDRVDPETRREVESLLAAHDVAPADPVAEGPGSVIDRYKLLQQIGEGGFGIVYMAEQVEPVRRKVALKIIRLGMDTRNVIARFEAERQALALMDHPNIAKVLDAGATGTGRPYFVMELVKGVPITEYCDQAQADTRSRLRLVRKVCAAIQHAHQKGIIHRDLKPNNVLVTLHDGVPVPKVIDFGIAKATSHRLTEKTLFTEFRQMIGTPDYMAPEQAEMSGLDVDTRADIYSIGVLLYELLTGSKPFDIGSLIRQGYDAMLRTIREVDPPRPSTRLSTMGEQLAAVAKHRHIAPAQLGKLMRGDLDWIVMKAMEKDRSRRYETATGLALDIQRYLADEPVHASPPSAPYRARKYLRRHRVGVTAAAVVFAALIVSGGLAYAGKREADRQTRAELLAEAEARRHADAARTAQAAEREQRTRAETGAAEARKETVRSRTVLEFVGRILTAPDPYQVKGHNYTVRRLLDDFDRELGDQLRDQPEVEATIRSTMGLSYLGLGLLDKAEPHLRSALETNRRRGEESAAFAGSLQRWASLLHGRGRYAEAEQHMRRALEIRRRLPQKNEIAIANAIDALADYARHQRRLDEAEKLAHEALAIFRRILGEGHPAVAAVLHNLSMVHSLKGDHQGSERVDREALAIRRRALGNDHIDVAKSLHNLAYTLHVTGRWEEAAEHYRESIRIRRRFHGDDHGRVAYALYALADTHRMRNQYTEAEAIHREALAMRRKVLPARHRDMANSLRETARLVRIKGAWAEAEKLYREAYAIRVARKENAYAATNLLNVAQAVARQGRHDESVQLARKALALRPKGYHSVAFGRALDRLAFLRRDRGDFAGAESLFRTAHAVWQKLGDKPMSIQALSELAWAVAKQDRHVDAEKLYRELLAMHPEDSGRRHLFLNMLGAALTRQGRFAEAEPMLLESYEKAAPGRRKAEARGFLIDLYEAWKKPDKAAAWRKKR